jgi:acylpyruvate hydrolase
MPLITLSWNGGTAAAVAVDEGRARIVGGDEPAYADVGALLRAGDEGLERADDAVNGGGREVRYDAQDLRRPVLSPGAVFCVGLNYRSHLEEMAMELPQAPTIFTKLPRALTDPYAPVRIPAAAASRLDYEGELAVVIGRRGRDIAPGSGWAHVAGMTVLNDVSMRDYQMRSMQWFAGKSWQGSTPVGPAVVLASEAGSLDEMELTVSLNGEVRQHGRVDDLLFDVDALVCDLSRIVELEPGDIIATGTPGGVGEAMDPKGYIRDGDVVEVSITGVGSVRNQFEVAG